MVLKLLLEIGSSVAFDEVDQLVVEELVLSSIVVGGKRLKVIRQVVHIIAESEPHMIFVFALVPNLLCVPDEITLAHFCHSREEYARIPVILLQGSTVSHVGHLARLVLAQRVGNGGVGG